MSANNANDAKYSRNQRLTCVVGIVCGLNANVINHVVTAEFVRERFWWLCVAKGVDQGIILLTGNSFCATLALWIDEVRL